MSSTSSSANKIPRAVYSTSNVEDSHICVVMVGLPARGKSLIAQKIVRYLKWLSVNAKSFNVGTYRRADTPQPKAEFFDVHNSEGERLRRAAAEAAVNDMMRWFEKDGGHVGVLDATNSTKKRREWITRRCEEKGYEVLFVESLCEDETLIMNNIREVKTRSPDYKGQDPEAAAKDFMARIKNYEEVYETVDDENVAYVKLINVGSQVIINRVQNYLQSRIIYFTMNLHITPRSIWLSRHGESQYNVEGKIGGDADLSERGRRYALALPNLVKDSIGDTEIELWTSTMKRTIQTAEHLPYKKKQWKALDELDAGVCDGLTYEEIEQRYPEDFRARDDDKYNYRYQGGESYRDVVIRLEPIIMEMERGADIMVVTHQAVLRCIYAYFMNVPQDQSPWMEIPLHTVIKLTPRAYGTQEERFKAEIPAVSTFRAKYAHAHMGSTESTVDEAALANQRAAAAAAAAANAVEQPPPAYILTNGITPHATEQDGVSREELIAEHLAAKEEDVRLRGVREANSDTLLKE